MEKTLLVSRVLYDVPMQKKRSWETSCCQANSDLGNLNGAIGWGLRNRFKNVNSQKFQLFLKTIESVLFRLL